MYLIHVIQGMGSAKILHLVKIKSVTMKELLRMTKAKRGAPIHEDRRDKQHTNYM